MIQLILQVLQAFTQYSNDITQDNKRNRGNIDIVKLNDLDLSKIKLSKIKYQDTKQYIEVTYNGKPFYMTLPKLDNLSEINDKSTFILLSTRNNNIKDKLKELNTHIKSLVTDLGIKQECNDIIKCVGNNTTFVKLRISRNNANPEIQTEIFDSNDQVQNIVPKFKTIQSLVLINQIWITDNKYGLVLRALQFRGHDISTKTKKMKKMKKIKKIKKITKEPMQPETKPLAIQKRTYHNLGIGEGLCMLENIRFKYNQPISV